jgi:FG-GAP-like repeat/ASPIC and UnbV
MNSKYLLPFIFFASCFYSCDNSTNKKSSTDHVVKEKSNVYPGTQQMMDSISAILSRVQFRNHPYDAAEKLKLVEAEVISAKAQNNVNIQLYLDYGKTLLNAGRSQDAINVFEELLSKLPENKVINETTKTLHEALAISYMRLGEQINCRDNHSSESCLMPIKGEGIHNQRFGSEKAIQIYQDILAVFPNDLDSRWLLNLAYMTLGEYPSAVPTHLLIPPKAFASEYDLPTYENVAMYLGVDMNDLAGGVITDDFNNDGFIDIIASSWALHGQIRYFKNMGDGSFSDITEQAGLSTLTGGLNLIQADYNNDGYLDFYCIRGAWSGLAWMGHLPNSLLKNNGDGTFSDVTLEVGLYGEHPTQSAVWFDYNNDGWIDLFVGNETHTPQEPHPVEMFENQKDDTFKNVTSEVGLDFTAFVKGTAAGDINNDGLMDLYISNLTSPNKLFLNKGIQNNNVWAFEEIGEKAKVTDPQESFPTWFFDYDNDGNEDLFVSCYDNYMFKAPTFEVASDLLGKPLRSDYPRMYKNRGDGTFSNVTNQVHLNHIYATMGCNYGDLDNDGFLDFYLGTGAPDYRAVIPNKMFRNNQGKTFQDVTSAGNFGHVQKGHGIAFSDLDNDGDQDIYAVMGGAVSGDVFQNALFENPGNNNQWITLQLKGTKSNRAAIGARIKITVENKDGTTRTIYNTLNSGGSFGANSLQIEVGLGDCKRITNIAVNWPDGNFEYVDYGSATPGNTYRIEEGKSTLEVVARPSFHFRKEMNHPMSH